MVDLPKVVQAVAVQVYMQSLDIVQQLDPLPGSALDAHAARVDSVLADVAAWLRALTPDDLDDVVAGRPAATTLGTHDAGYPADAVQLVLETRIRAASDLCDQQGITLSDFIRATGEYLAAQDDHKQGWLAERAANLLVAGAA